MSATNTATVAKARLRNFGDGVLELTDNSIRFYAKTGRFRKQRKISREIQFADVESVERQGNDLRIVWKDNTDMFALEQPSQVEPIHKRITAALKERRKDQETKEPANQEWNALGQTTAYAIETADSLFKILENLHGRVDWKLMEGSLMQFEKNVGKLSSQGANPVCLNVKPVSVAVQQHRPEEIAEKTYDILKELYEHFDGLASSVEDSEQPHPNRRDAKLVIQAIYVLNDMVLSSVVGDDAVGKEGVELLKALEDLAKLPGSRVDVNAVKMSLDKLCTEKEKQRVVVEEIKLTIEQKLKELIVPPAGNPPTTVDH
jgi:hypothetical protein